MITLHIAIITEYNPFHLGHEYQINEVRKAFPGATVTAVMGGIFSQRGEPYITDPYTRAAAALACGVDLVVELPFPFSASPAGIFARAGVEIASKIGADMLVFGSECGDIAKLSEMLCRLDSEKMQNAVKNAMNDETFAAMGKTKVYSEIYKKLYGDSCADKPNDILALEYLRAIKNGGYKITPYTVKRIGDFKSGEDGFPSATSIRESFRKNGISALCDTVPKNAKILYETAYANRLFGTDEEKLASAVLMKLCDEKLQTFSGDGLEKHLARASIRVKTVEELKKVAATKGYTNAEISRRILYALLGVTENELSENIGFTRLLGANMCGREVINRVADFPVIASSRDLKKLKGTALEQYKKNTAAERAFALTFDGRYNCLTQKPVII